LLTSVLRRKTKNEIFSSDKNFQKYLKIYLCIDQTCYGPFGTDVICFLGTRQGFGQKRRNLILKRAALPDARYRSKLISAPS